MALPVHRRHDRAIVGANLRRSFRRPHGRLEPAGERHAKHVVTCNIPSCRRRDGQVDAARIADAVAEADIIGLQEVDRFAR